MVSFPWNPFYLLSYITNVVLIFILYFSYFVGLLYVIGLWWQEGIFFSLLESRAYLGLPVPIQNHLEVFWVSEKGRYAKYKDSETELALRQSNIYFDQRSHPSKSVKQFKPKYFLLSIYPDRKGVIFHLYCITEN